MTEPALAITKREIEFIAIALFIGSFIGAIGGAFGVIFASFLFDFLILRFLWSKGFFKHILSPEEP